MKLENIRVSGKLKISYIYYAIHLITIACIAFIYHIRVAEYIGYNFMIGILIFVASLMYNNIMSDITIYKLLVIHKTLLIESDDSDDDELVMQCMYESVMSKDNASLEYITEALKILATEEKVRPRKRTIYVVDDLYKTTVQIDEGKQ